MPGAFLGDVRIGAAFTIGFAIGSLAIPSMT